MRSGHDTVGGVLAWAGGSGREQLELWSPGWRPVEEREPEASTEAVTERTRELDPFQLSLGVFGGTR